ncbi:DUF413 domain-containing protein [Planctobacterium marinum]|uniref:DUF413 domain-containing protein n=1 Tax=Planctobacterium marinum TaxID=1631968 RepID=UPI001E2EC0A2|nr:DUF413 domain-containing protein [Planctobacterium marinum]MCC2606512.1 DUF413 domain-containing protein [Planctobacterium marinum]
MQLEQGFVVAEPFRDQVNFPYGFGKSGDFSINEARLLASLGSRLSKLEQGIVEPQNQVEEAFVEMCLSFREPTTNVERLWRKYLRLTTTRRFHTLHGCSRIHGKDVGPVELGDEL